MVAGVLLVLSFHEASKEIFDHRQLRLSLLASETDGDCGPFLGAAGGWALWRRRRSPPSRVLYLASKVPDRTIVENRVTARARWCETARRQWLPVGLLSLMMFLFVWWLLDSGPLLPTILANVAMIVLGFWLIGTGLREDSGRTFAAGVVYLLVWAVMRYIDLFGDFGGMLGAAGMFLACGVALFAVAWFWRHRKEVQHV